MYFTNLFENKEMLLNLSEYLSDKDSFSLFRCNKNMNNIIKYNKKKYTVKSFVCAKYSDRYRNMKMILLNDVIKQYKVVNVYQTKMHYIPKTLEKLILNNCMSKNFDTLPSSIKYLEFLVNVNNSYFSLPDRLTKLTTLKLDACFNMSLSLLPENIKHLTLGDCFDCSIDSLPKSLEHLELGNKFNKSVDKLPSTLKYLKLGSSFNQSIDNLPDNIEVLDIGCNFNKPINKLPKSLKYFKLGNMFNQEINNLPNGLINLTIRDYYQINPCKYMFYNYRGEYQYELSFNQRIDNLPQSLEYLELGDKFDQPVDKLPSTLKHLKLGKHFKQSLKNLTCSLESLTLSRYYIGKHIPFRYRNIVAFV